jgi:ATP-dependent DNA ligase
MPLQKRPLPFDHPDWIFELKLDGFRALAVIEHRPELVSRNGHPFGSFADLAKQIAAHLPANTVLDGEIVWNLHRAGIPALRPAGSERPAARSALTTANGVQRAAPPFQAKV